MPDFATFTDNGNGTGTIQGTPQATDVGNYTITIVATAVGIGGIDAAQTDQQSFVLSVPAAGVPPILTPIGDKVAVLGAPLTFTVRATDPAQELLTFSTMGLPMGAMLVPTNTYGVAAFSWTPTAAQAGVYPVTITVSDDGGGNPANVLSTSQTIQLVAQATDAGPLLLPVRQPEHQRGTSR